MNILFGNDLKQVMDSANRGYQIRGFQAINAECLLKSLIEEETTIVKYFEDKEIYIDELDDMLSYIVEEKEMKAFFEDKPKNNFRSKFKRFSRKKDVQNVKSKDKIDDIISSKEELNLKFADGTEVTVIVDDEVLAIFKKSESIANEINEEEIDEEIFTSAMIEVMPKVLSLLFKKLGIRKKEAMQELEYKQVKHSKLVPKKVRTYISVLNDDVNVKEECTISGRDEEVDKLFTILSKHTKRNAILVGEPGVGKTSVIEKLTYLIVSKKAPKQFHNCFIAELSVNALIAGTQYRGQAEEKFRDVIEYIEKTPNLILFIDEVHTILGAGATGEKNGELDFSNALKSILASGKTRIIGATTIEEYERYFQRDGALSRRFEKIEIEEPKMNEVYDMIKVKVDQLSKFHGVRVSREMVDYIILMAYSYRYNLKNPDKSIDLLDRSMVKAKVNNKDEVDKECVLSNFSKEIEIYNSMPDEIKKITAYHEAGHYIVSKYSPYMKNFEVILVSIMPAEDYVGVNVYERKDGIYMNMTRDYFIDNIAKNLAGRIAEQRLTKEFSCGASQDIETATKMAYDYIAYYGLSKKFNNYKALLDENQYNLITEKTVEMINEEIDDIMDEARMRAQLLIDENIDVFNKVVEQLLEKGILSSLDLKEITK